jgi:tRNA nucleotidyltransferase/poly(A) polymerase
MTVIDVDPLSKEIGERFAAAGHELYLVGGVVRDRRRAARDDAGPPRLG